MTVREKKLSAEIELESFGYKQELHRSLTMWHLTAFGLNYMIPIAPAIIFGIVLVTTGGTVALPYLLAFIGMSFTANSYAVLVRHFPLAGSLYSYVGRGIDSSIGFISGWVLLLDYILVPTVTSVSASFYIQQFFPSIPFEIFLFIFTSGTGLLNIFNINLMAKLGLGLLLIGEIVIFTAFFVWGYAVSVNKMGVGTLLSMEPFKFINLSCLASGTSIAVLSYLGFDAITTLSEEAINPKKDIPKAIFISVMIGALTMFLTGYIGMLVIPDWQKYCNNTNWVNTTLFYVSKITGGNAFAAFYTSGFLLAMAVFNIVATAAGSRLLYGMGRDRVLPYIIFGKINKKWKTPHWNILIIVLLEFSIGSLFSLDRITELVNYGALAGFILLNLSVIWLYYVKRENEINQSKNILVKFTRNFMAPFLGMLVLGWVFLNMSKITLLVGTIWLILGMVYLICQSKGFIKRSPHFD